MELNLASSITHNVTSGHESCGQLLEGFTPRVQLRETRSAYFINVNLSGFRKEDIRLEMDNTRTLIIKGQRYLRGMGKVEWTWHLMESGGRSFRKPFRVPHNVNVGTMTGTFHQGVLHVLMPKFRWTSRFTPYHINRSNSQDAQALEEAAQDEAKENAGEGHGAEKLDDSVGARSNEEKEAHDQKPPEISTVEEQSNPDDTHLQQGRINEAAAAASTSYDNAEEPLQQHRPATAPDLHHEKPSCLGSKGDAGKEVAEEEKKIVVEDMGLLTDHKEKDNQHSQQKDALNLPAEEVIAHQEVAEEEKKNVVEDMGFLTDHKEKDDQHSQQKDALNLPAEEVIAHQEVTCPLYPEAEEKKKNVVEDMGLLTDHKEKDDQHSHQKDALNLPEEVIADQEVACPLSSEAEEDTDHAKQEPEKVVSSNGIDEYIGIISHWNYEEAFWSRRKIVISLLVSSVAVIAAYKLMRR